MISSVWAVGRPAAVVPMTRSLSPDSSYINIEYADISNTNLVIPQSAANLFRGFKDRQGNARYM
jgi:hypothetical protein